MAAGSGSPSNHGAVGAKATGAYSPIAVLLHWTIAALILTNMILGWGFHIFEQRGPADIKLHHQGIGMVVLVLSVLRLLWRLTHKPPPLPAHLKAWERVTAHIVHWALYVFMIATPLAGWMLLSTNKTANNYLLFTFLPLPWIAPLHDMQDAALRAWLHDAFVSAHHALVLGMAALLLLHVAGALKHKLIDRDNELSRMIPFLRRVLP